MIGGEIYDIHIRRCAAVGFVMPFGATSDYRNKKGRGNNKTGRAKINTACR